MSTHTPTPVALPSSVTIPDGGDARTAASVNVALETALNAIKRLENLVFTGALWVPLSTAPVSTNFTAQDDPGLGRYWEQTSVAAVGELGRFEAPNTILAGVELTHLDVFWNHIGSHGSVPATKPAFILTKLDRGASPAATTPDGEIVDTDLWNADSGAPNSVATYEAGGMASFDIASGNYLDADSIYWLEVRGEAGGGAELGFQFLGARLRAGAPA